MNPRRFLAGLATALVASLAAVPARAASIWWTGDAGDHNWYTAGNWSLSKVPGAADDVEIDADDVAAVDASSPTVAFASLTVGDPEGVFCPTLRVPGDLRIGSGVVAALNGLECGPGAAAALNVAGRLIADGRLSASGSGEDAAGAASAMAGADFSTGTIGVPASPFSAVGSSGVAVSWLSSYPPGAVYLAQLSTGAWPNAFAGNRSASTAALGASFTGLAPRTTYYAQVSAPSVGAPLVLGSTMTLAAPPVFTAMRLGALASPGASLVPAAVSTGLFIYPNPFRPSQGHVAVTFAGLSPGARVRIYTLDGELVNDLTGSPAGVAVWNGSNEHGSAAASGVYFALIEAAAGRTVARVAVQR